MNRRGFLRAFGLAPVAASVVQSAAPAMADTVSVCSTSFDGPAARISHEYIAWAKANGSMVSWANGGMVCCAPDGEHFLFNAPLHVSGATLG